MKQLSIIILAFSVISLIACDIQNTSQNSTESPNVSSNDYEKSNKYQSQGTLIVARASEPEWLNPVAGHQHADSDIAIFRGLFKRDRNNIIVGDMADDWQIDQDGRTYTISLRPNIRWHDGAPFTAEDVQFTLETILNPKNHSNKRKDFLYIESIEIVDPLTVRINLTKPLSSLLSKLTLGLIPKHVLDGKDFNTDEFNNARPVGTGPFKLKEYRRGEYLILEANKDFYDGAPKLQRVIYKFLPDPNVRLLQLKKGEIDVARLNPKQLAAIKPEDGIRTEVVDTADYLVMMFNFREKLFQDVRIRRAIQCATDRNALVQGALMGYGYPAHGPLQFNTVSKPELGSCNNNLELSRTLLADAGWEIGQDGLMQKNGQKMSFPIFVMANDPIRQDLAVLLSQQLRKAGIDAPVQVRDYSTFKIKQVPAFILGGGLPGEPDEDVYPYFLSSNAKHGSNFSGYNNPEVDKLLEQGRATLNAQEQQTIYQKLQTELIKNPPYNYLVYLKHVYGVRDRANGFAHKVFGHGTSPLWNIEQWSVTQNP